MSTLTLNPTSVTGGVITPRLKQSSAQGTVTLTDSAPAGGLGVALAATVDGAPTDKVLIPAAVTVPAGQRSASFEIVTKAVDADTTVIISGQTASGIPVPTRSAVYYRREQSSAPRSSTPLLTDFIVR